MQRRAFASAEAALQAVLAQSPAVSVLAFGEVHAPAGAQVPSSAARFRTELLPTLTARAAAIVVEAWLPQGCNRAAEAKVAEVNRDVTAHQAPTNTNDYVAIADAANKAGMVALPLRPSCEETERVAKAGQDDVATLLTVVTEVAQRTLLSARAKAPRERLVLFYGGALHNDRVPATGREAWSFAPALEHTLDDSAFVELDLVVPEFIGDNDTWKKLPWFSAYDAERDGDRVQLLHVRQRRDGAARELDRYVLVFARQVVGSQAPAASPAPTETPR